MLRNRLYLIFSVTLILLAGTSCQKSSPSPVANAGPDQTVAVGDMVTLNGSGSSGQGLSFAWSFESKPTGSAAEMDNASTAGASFIADVVGEYLVTLTVSNDGGGDTDAVSVTATSSGAGGGTLEPGETFIGEDGVVLGAPEGALDTALEVAVRSEAPPEIPLPEEAQAIGEFYRISAAQDTFGAENPFLVGFPISEGADTSSSALAVLLEPGDVIDSDFEGPVWQLLEGVYDPEGNYFITTLPVLAAEGRIVGLVTAEDFESPTVSAAPTVSAQQTGPGFRARCRRFSNENFNNRGISCSSADEEDLETVLEDASSDFTGLGFFGPLLRRRIDHVSLLPLPHLVRGEYIVKLYPYRDVEAGKKGRPCGESPNGIVHRGSYNSFTHALVVCIDDNGVTGVAVETARHEYFHATQFSYIGTFASKAWVIEGTATASENSLATMTLDGSRDPHPIDVPLTAEDDDKLYEYRAQDFFVYVGLKLGRGLNYLIDVFQKGASTKDVDRGLKALGVSGGLPQLYWDWVKNQAFEASVTGGNLGVGEPCKLNPDVIEEEERIGGAIVLPSVSFNPFDGIGGYSNLVTELRPLTSRVYEITLEAYQSSYFVDIRVNIDNPDIKIKFYEDYGDFGTTACQTTPDGRTYTTGVDYQSGLKTVYMLVSNIGFNHTPVLFTNPNNELFFENVRRPSVEIVEPDDATVVPEGAGVSFSAEVENPLGGPVTFDWFVDGQRTDFFTETFTTRFCPGDHSVRVVASLGSLADRTTVSDRITVTAENNSPIVTITSAPTSIGEDNDLRLEGSVTDPTCEDSRGTRVDLDHLIWDLEDGFGGTGASIIASFTSQGNKTVTLSYTDAGGAFGSDEVVVPVGAFDPDSDPVVAIKAPQDNRHYSVNEISGSHYVIAVEGYASNSVSNADVVWSYREKGSSSWIEFAHGRSATLNLLPPLANKDYDLLLHIDGEPICSPSQATCSTSQVISITVEAVIR